MRPKAMKYFDELGDNSFDEFEVAIAAGKKIVGIYCEYSPRELILAADAIPICLCGYNQNKIPPAEEILPRTLCPLIKSSFGYVRFAHQRLRLMVVTESCPFFTASEFVIAETTCDGKKKMYEILQRWKPMFVLELTQKPNEEMAFQYWLSQVEKLKEYIEERLQVEITDEKLKRAIKLMNEERKTLKELQECLRVHPVPMSGYDMSLVFGRVVDREIYMSHVRELLSELKDMSSPTTKRLMDSKRRVCRSRGRQKNHAHRLPDWTWGGQSDKDYRRMRRYNCVPRILHRHDAQ